MFRQQPQNSNRFGINYYRDLNDHAGSGKAPVAPLKQQEAAVITTFELLAVNEVEDAEAGLGGCATKMGGGERCSREVHEGGAR
jgi:hypothetical protein